MQNAEITKRSSVRALSKNSIQQTRDTVQCVAYTYVVFFAIFRLRRTITFCLHSERIECTTATRFIRFHCVAYKRLGCSVERGA